jgi:hypothetical protein
MVGAIILGYPIVWLSFKDIRKGNLTINELVGIAVLAAFASGDYKTAGLVAFFMLMGEIIETRTAAISAPPDPARRRRVPPPRRQLRKRRCGRQWRGHDAVRGRPPLVDD